ncbi:MAG: hypothetical protein V1793_23220 [Pseudomonadota bacterium]
MVNTDGKPDIRGVGRLAVDAIIGITNLVESVHHTIASLGGFIGNPDQERTTGITGMVYHNIRTLSKLAGDTIDQLLKQFPSHFGDMGSSPGYETALSALI